MPSLVRFTVSMEENLLGQFDELIRAGGYTNRSEAIRDLIRKELVKREWAEDRVVVGVITLVYDHHVKELVGKVMDIQHDCHESIMSTQHIHLDHHNCFEIIVTRGKAKEIDGLYQKLKSLKSVKHAGIMTATGGENIP